MAEIERKGIPEETSTEAKPEFVKPKAPDAPTEEAKFKAKYPNLGKPGGSDFIRQRLLNKGPQKYFDSGDYQMAKQTGKLRPGPKVNGGKSGLIAGTTGAAIPTPASLPHRKTSTEVSKLAV